MPQVAAVRKDAQGVGAISIRFEDHTDADNRSFTNWIAIRHESGTAGRLPVSAQVDPLHVAHGLLRVQDAPTLRGDANFDEVVDISDARTILGSLFLGEGTVACVEAADFNEDERINVSDAIGVLNYLLRGGPGSSVPEVYCEG